MFILVTFILDFFFYQMLLREGGQPKTQSTVKWHWVQMKAFWVMLTVSFSATELNTYPILQTATYRVSYLVIQSHVLRAKPGSLRKAQERLIFLEVHKWIKSNNRKGLISFAYFFPYWNKRTKPAPLAVYSGKLSRKGLHPRIPDKFPAHLQPQIKHFQVLSSSTYTEKTYHILSYVVGYSYATVHNCVHWKSSACYRDIICLQETKYNSEVISQYFNALLEGQFCSFLPHTEIFGY